LKPNSVSLEQLEQYIQEISMAPGQLREAVRGLDDPRLDTPYRQGGWTVRQVVHHLPDSHANAYVRFKLALTEHEPLVRTYEEKLWAELPEAKSAPVEISLALLEALHARWLSCIRGLSPEAFKRTYRHPVSGLTSLNELLALYSWHGRHHVAQITSLCRRNGWK
jgi:uncharacterized damage-inducible protein DinB